MFFLLSLFAYLVGSVPFGYLIVLIFEGSDIRSTGSGNIGATNVMRTLGLLGAVCTLILDIAKGYLVVLFTNYVEPNNSKIVAVVMISVVVGHVFPIFLKFRGGKGVATSAGVLLYLSLTSVLITFIIFGLVVFFTRIVSLGSIIAVVSCPIVYFFLVYRQEPIFPIFLASLCCAVLVILCHWKNICRILAGSENRLIR